MRQAGRYHRHYQHLRQKHTFMELCKTPQLATEVTLGPLEAFNFDGAILFSDLLFPLELLGMGCPTTKAPRNSPGTLIVKKRGLSLRLLHLLETLVTFLIFSFRP